MYVLFCICVAAGLNPFADANVALPNSQDPSVHIRMGFQTQQQRDVANDFLKRQARQLKMDGVDKGLRFYHVKDQAITTSIESDFGKNRHRLCMTAVFCFCIVPAMQELLDTTPCRATFKESKDVYNVQVAIWYVEFST